MMYKIFRSNGIKYSFFDHPSLDAFLKAGSDRSKAHPENRRLDDIDSSLGVEGGHEGWRQYVRSGAQREQKRIRELASQFQMKTPKGIRTRRRAIRGPQGDELDIHSVRSGNLDRAWRRTHKIEKKGKAKRITILYNTPIYGSQSASVAFYGPAVAAVLCEKLNQAKVSIEIISMDWTGSMWKDNASGVMKDLTIVRIKNTNAPLSLAALAATATAGFTRSALFGAQLASELPCARGMGGRDQNCSDELIRATLQRPAGEAIIVPKIYDEQTAINFITKTIKEFEK